MPRVWPKGHVHVCELCGTHAVPRFDAYCAECWDFMARYRQHINYNRDRLLLRQIHALRQRVALELPLFQGGKLCV